METPGTAALPIVDQEPPTLLVSGVGRGWLSGSGPHPPEVGRMSFIWSLSWGETPYGSLVADGRDVSLSGQVRCGSKQAGVP